MMWPLAKGLAGSRWLAEHINLLKRTSGHGQFKVAAPPDVVIASPESQCKVEDFVTGSIFRAGSLRTAKLRRQAYLDQVSQERAAAQLQAEQEEAAAQLQANQGDKKIAVLAHIEVTDAADALGVRQLGPGIFIGPSDLAFDQQVLKAGNFKATLVFDIKLPHQTSDSGISRFTMNTSWISERSLAHQVRDASLAARFGDSTASGNLLVASDHSYIDDFLEKYVSPLMDGWSNMSAAELKLQRFQIPA